jgi:hypothetical protein
MPRKTVADWTAKGWSAETIAAGDTGPIEISMDPATQDLVVKGQLYDSSGEQLTGARRPKIRVEDTATGAEISLRAPAEADVVVLYKVVEEDEDEPDEPVG